MYRQSLDEVDSPMRPRMPMDHTSELDGPRKPRKPDIFQNELANKLKDRKKLGLTADLTSEESEDEVVGNLDSRSQFGVNRPASATRRPDRSPEWKPNLEDSLRHSDFGVSHRYQSGYDDEDREVAALGSGTMGFPKVERSGFRLPGTKKPSPREQFDSGLHGRKTPTGKHTPVNELGGPSKEDMIFGAKTQTEEPKSKGSFFKRKSAASMVGEMTQGDINENKQWQPPSFRKSPTEQRELHNRTPSPAGSRGRKTPSSLDPISEAGTPRDVRGDVRGETQVRPRLRRQGSTSSDKMSPRVLSVESSPRSDKPTPRPRHTGEKDSPKDRKTVDIFGKSRRLMDDEEPESEVRPQPKRRGSSEMSKTTPSGRRTPTEKKTVSGRKTPTLLKTTPGYKSQGRLTPTGRKSPLDELVKPKEEKAQKQTSLLGYLTGETEATANETSTKKKTRERSNDSLTRERTRDGMTRERSRDGMTRERSKDGLSRERSEDRLTRERSKDNLKRERSRESLTRQRSQDSIDSGPMLSLQQPRKPTVDDSSLCEELTHDPQSKTKKAQEDGKTRRIQRSDRQQADDAICGVADAQMTFIEPDGKEKQKSAKTDKKMSKHRPQPRYPTLPGQSTEEPPRTFEDTVSIRQAIYDEWYHQRMKEAKKKALEQKKKEKEEEENELKKKKEKQENGVAAFTAWSKNKEKTLSETARKMREEEQRKEKAKRDEKTEKEKDMIKTFNIWKERKDSTIKDTVRKNTRLKHDQEEEENKKKREREEKGSSAFRSWKSKKEELLIEKAKEEKQKEKANRRNEKYSRESKDKDATQKYEEWLEIKEKREREEKSKRRLSERELQERPPWSPANKTVPFGR